MRYKFEHFERHPSEAYASGDFEIHYLEDELTHKVSARVVVCVADYKGSPRFAPAPIYASNINAARKLRELISNKIKGEPHWSGAKIKVIKYGNTSYCYNFIGPYFDMRGYLNPISEDYFIFQNGGDLRFNSNGLGEVAKSYFDEQVGSNL
jgi:hypothetical protein